MLEENSEDARKNRMYKEVKYARMTSTRFKPTAKVFRLRCDYKMLSSQEYADNLSSYLEQNYKSREITLEYLWSVIDELLE